MSTKHLKCLVFFKSKKHDFRFLFLLGFEAVPRGPALDQALPGHCLGKAFLGHCLEAVPRIPALDQASSRHCLGKAFPRQGLVRPYKMRPQQGTFMGGVPNLLWPHPPPEMFFVSLESLLKGLEKIWGCGQIHPPAPRDLFLAGGPAYKSL